MPQVKRSNQRSAKRNKYDCTARGFTINDEVSDLMVKMLENYEDVEILTEEVTKKFVWFPKLREFSKSESMGKGQDENSDKSEEVTMWYKPTECELHKWIKVAKSSLPKCENDVTEGYGVFAERQVIDRVC